jgi:hypothetical protein
VISQAGIHQRIENVMIVALYERDSGDIKHVHAVVNFEGGRSVTEEEAGDACRRQAARLGHPIDELLTVMSTKLEHASRPHKIDTATGAFVPM